MLNKNIAVIQSLSCFGKSSITVALPVLSALGLSTAAIPTVILSTHTGGFGTPERVNLDDFLEPTFNHWQKNNVTFDGILTGYISSEKQIDDLIKNVHSIKKECSVFLCDPAFADNGKMYNGFSDNFPEKMLSFCKMADIITPNLTEACLLTSTEYKTDYDILFIEKLLNKLYLLTDSTVIITGLCIYENKITSAIIEKGNISYVSAKKIPSNYHGAGDIFASCIIGGLLKGNELFISVEKAMDFVSSCLKETYENFKDERIGICFENQLSNLIKLYN